MAFSISNGRFTAADADGVPLTGGKLNIYQAGSGGAVRLDSYTTSALTVPNANPVVLNASGQAPIWIDPASSYLLVLTDSLDAVLWTEDNYHLSTSFNVTDANGNPVTIS